MMTTVEMGAVIDRIRFGDWTFMLGMKGETRYLQILFKATDAVTGVVELQHGRKWMLSEHMTESEIVQTAFKATLTAMEHEVREKFTYREKAIFGPHFDVNALVELAEREEFDVRKEAAG